MRVLNQLVSFDLLGFATIVSRLDFWFSLTCIV